MVGGRRAGHCVYGDVHLLPTTCACYHTEREKHVSLAEILLMPSSAVISSDCPHASESKDMIGTKTIACSTKQTSAAGPSSLGKGLASCDGMSAIASVF